MAAGRARDSVVARQRVTDGSADLPAALAAWERARRPLTEHTQRWSARSWPKSRWPLFAVRWFYNLPLWERWVGIQRARPAMAVPHGTDPAAVWTPAAPAPSR